MLKDINEDTTSQNDVTHVTQDDHDGDNWLPSSEGTGEGGSGEEGDETVTLTKSALAEREREIRREQDKRWKERLANSGKPVEHKKPEPADERIDRYYLDSKGIETDEAQELVLDYAKYKKCDVREALKAPVVVAELARLQEKKTKQDSVPPPSPRTSPARENDVEYWARMKETKNQSAPTAEMRIKVRRYLAQRDANR